MRKEEKKNRQKVLLVWLFLTGLLLTMTTYAWFSTNRIFEIESFDIQVASKGGIEVSTDAIDWKGVVGMLDFVQARNSYPNNLNQIPNIVRPVSSAGEVENGRLKLYYGEVEMENYYYLHASRTVETAALMDDSDGIFVAFDLFLRTNSPKRLTIAAGSGVSYKDDVSQATGIENAFRLAFINQGTLAEDRPLAQIQNQNSGTNSFIWEVNYDRHTADAIAHALNTYGITTTTTNAPRLAYDGIRNDIDPALRIDVGRANATNYPNLFRRVEPQLATTAANNTIQDFINIEAGITKLRVYVWLEGQDVDCEDNASYGDLAINLQFVAH